MPRLAVEAALAGRYSEALKLYRRLALEQPAHLDQSAFTVAVQLLQRPQHGPFGEAGQ